MKLNLKFHFLSILLSVLYLSVLAGKYDDGPSGAPGDVEIEVSYTKGSANFTYSIAYVIWIENGSENYIQNLYVCNRLLNNTLTGNALPYWKMNKYPDSEVDGVTGATQKNTDFSVKRTMIDNSIRQFKVYMEVDHSFDSNDWFWDQPALLYSADIDLDNLQAEYTLIPVGWTRNNNLGTGGSSNVFKDDPPHTSPAIGELQAELRYITNQMNGTGFGDVYPDNRAAINIVGSLTAIITIAPDDISPTIPSNLSGTAASSNVINLTWNASTDNVEVTGYHIYRDGNPIATSITNSYSDTALTPLTSYLYAISAFDAENNTSELSEDTLITTLPAANLSARFDSIVVPDNLITDEVFDVYITLTNNGSITWGESEGQEGVTLVSKEPDFNSVWGTYFIIKGQGHPVAPGESFTFSAPLRAPHEPGVFNMSWQCQNWIPAGGHVPDLTTIPFFGEIASTSIHVTQRQEVEPPDPTPSPGVISISDFEYIGSFKLPGMAGFEDTYNESGLTFRIVDDQKHLIVGTGTYATDMYELGIPQPVAIVDGNHDLVPVAPFVHDWGPMDFGTDNPNGERVYPNCGFWFDNENSTMYWTHYNSYYTGGPSGFPTLVSTRFNADGTTTHLNGWYIPDGYNPFKSYWGGVLKLSDNFATRYTGGRDMAVGFGGYYSICGSASRGPSLGAIARPDPEQSTMDLLPMMTYIDGISACPRDGNYFSNIYWITRPPNPWTGEWTGVDGTRAGIFIDMPDKKGYISFAKQGIGRIGYDYGGYNADGHYQDVWYFYDIKDLGAVALGDKVETSVLPDTYSTVQYPIPGEITSGACFDEETRLLYVYVMQSIPKQYGASPIIHVYHLTEESDNVTLVDQTFDQFADDCFGAFQNIVVSDDGDTVEFQSGSSVNLIAGNSIQFLPGTHIQEGAYVHASITTDGTFCEQLGTPVGSNISIEKASKINDSEEETVKEMDEQLVKIFPNPSSGKFTVELTNFQNPAQVSIVNMVGSTIYPLREIISTRWEIDLTTASKGVYIVRLIDGESVISKRIIVN